VVAGAHRAQHQFNQCTMLFGGKLAQRVGRGALTHQCRRVGHHTHRGHFAKYGPDL